MVLSESRTTLAAVSTAMVAVPGGAELNLTSAIELADQLQGNLYWRPFFVIKICIFTEKSFYCIQY